MAEKQTPCQVNGENAQYIDDLYTEFLRRSKEPIDNDFRNDSTISYEDPVVKSCEIRKYKEKGL